MIKCVSTSTESVYKCCFDYMYLKALKQPLESDLGGTGCNNYTQINAHATGYCICLPLHFFVSQMFI